MNRMTNVCLTLLTLTIISIGLVSGVKRLSEQRIAENIRQVLIDQLSEIIAQDSYDNDLLATQKNVTINLHGITQTISHYQATKDDQHVADLILHVYPKGYSGDITLLTGIDATGKVLAVRVIAHRETPGLGDKIERRKSDWIEGFNGLSLERPKIWRVKQDGGPFDAFSGATITPRAIVNAVYETLHLAQQGL